MNVTRRKILASFAALMACFITRRGPAFALPAVPQKAEASATKLVSLFEHRHSAAAIGCAYLRNAPMEASVPVLLERLFPNQAEPHRWLTTTDTETVRRTLASQIRRDFKHGRVVNVDGWVLSLTESRLCGLAMLV